MNEKKQNQAVLLDNLIYLTCKEEIEGTKETVLLDPTKCENVGAYVDRLKAKGKEGCLIRRKDGTEGYPGTMEWKEWEEMLNAIKEDKELSSMKISECYDRQNAGPNDEFEKYLDKKFGKNRYRGETKIMVFTKGDSKKDSFVIFRGTSGDKEWADNTLLYQRGDTPANKEALAYMNYLKEKGYTDAYTSGHSKAGNKSIFVTLYSDIVKECLAYNAPDFSNSFLKQNKEMTPFMEKKETIKSIQAMEMIS